MELNHHHAYIHRYLKAGKFSPNSLLFTTLNLTGWTVTIPGGGMTRTLASGLAVWERFEELNIEYDD